MPPAREAPTGPPIGSASPGGQGVAPWASFTAQVREHVPELRWPRCNVTYDRMLTDAQVWGLYAGTVQPIEEYECWVDTNGNDLGRVALLADDLGVPIGEPAPLSELIEHTSLPGEFDFAALLHEALFAPIFGHYYFEWTGEVIDGVWRLTGLHPLHPSTLANVKPKRDGTLDYVQQAGTTIGLLGGTMWAGQPPKIGPERLVPFIFWPDAMRAWLGRSILRPLYRNWLCKDVLIRVDVTNHERAGGVPWVETDERYQGTSLEDLQRLASEFRVDEEGGAALPPGAALKLARAGGTDVVASVRYHDEQMSKAWQTMVRELGQTQTGSRALGQTFVDLEAMARRAMAGWVARTVSQWVMARWWFWNFGLRDAPVLRFTAPALETSAQGDGTGPPPVAAAARPSPRPRGVTAAADDFGGAFSRHRLPDRPLRRQPYETEVMAAVDFAAIDTIHSDAADTLDALFLQTFLPQQVASLGDQITYTRRGTQRRRVRSADMALVRAPVVGAEQMADVMLAVALSGAQEAVLELQAQGIDVATPSADDLRPLVADHAAAVAQQTADGLSLAASRRAVQLVGERTAAQIARDVATYLEGLRHTWERDMLAGAAQQAMNAGRLHVFEQVQTTTALYASELLDANTCSSCIAIDGRAYPSLAAARMDYPSGGYSACQGGPRCRGTVIAVSSAEVAPPTA